MIELIIGYLLLTFYLCYCCIFIIDIFKSYYNQYVYLRDNNNDIENILNSSQIEII